MDGGLALLEQTFLLKSWMVLEGDTADEDHLLIDTHSGVICSCNDAAWMLLEHLKAGASLSVLTEVLRDNYALGELDARRDALAFLHQLEAMGCVYDHA